MEWDERVKRIKKIKTYIDSNMGDFARNKNLQFFYGSLNRSLIDLNEKEIDKNLEKLEKEIND